MYSSKTCAQTGHMSQLSFQLRMAISQLVRCILSNCSSDEGPKLLVVSLSLGTRIECLAFALINFSIDERVEEFHRFFKLTGPRFSI